MTMDTSEFKLKIPIKLNEQQREAMNTVDGAVLLLAVPGSGKTTVLVARIGYMIYCKGIVPENILTLTYTVAAAKDMANRFASFFGEEMAYRLQFRTINSVCLQIIRYASEVSGRGSQSVFDIAEESERMHILSQIYRKTMDDFPTEAELRDIASQIAFFKNMMLSNDEIKNSTRDQDIPMHIIFKEYNATLYEKRMMDFDDQMVYAYSILTKWDQVLLHFQNLYSYICVDEAQDTSKIQHTIINLLSKKSGNLFMVGDEDQSIYGFRAAYPQALLEFEKVHDNAKVLLMEENFRSNANIVNAADGFIKMNTIRHEKNMRATRPGGTQIRIVDLKSRSAQYSYLTKVARDCDRQTAVLYRDNEFVIPLVDRLDREGIPYRIRNADLTFFTNRIVTDVSNIIRFAENTRDTELFMKIYYKINMYLKKAEAEKIAEISERKSLSIFDAADSLNLPINKAKALRGIQTHLKNMLTEPADKAIYRIYHYLGFGSYLERNHTADDKQFVLKMIAQNEPSPRDFLNRMEYLQNTIKKLKNDPDCSFILSTIHSSKGLEYETVYLMDVDDGLFPESVPQSLKRASNEEITAYEEERRLFYVGVTRAKDNLNIFKLPNGSTFIRQLMGEKDEKPALTQKEKRPIQATSYSSFKRKISDEEAQHFLREIGEGVIIRHKKFGRGVISEMDGRAIKVIFRDSEKTIDAVVAFSKGIIEVDDV